MNSGKTSKPRATGKTQPVVSAAITYWVLVWMPSGTPIPPYDSNPGSDDEGLMVYRSLKAAELAAAHQQEYYGCDDDSETATAIPLSQLGFKLSGGHKRKSR